MGHILGNIDDTKIDLKDSVYNYKVICLILDTDGSMAYCPVSSSLQKLAFVGFNQTEIHYLSAKIENDGKTIAFCGKPNLSYTGPHCKTIGIDTGELKSNNGGDLYYIYGLK